ncbi:MAG: hypothetical protein WBM07_09460 [Chitinivibrionales bacterium]
MWLVFFVLGILGTLLLFIHINLELNSLNRKMDNLVMEVKKHYGIK